MTTERWELGGTTVTVLAAADAATVLELVLQPVAEGKRAKVLRLVKAAFSPEPAPVPRGP